MTMCNMSIEGGARAGYVNPDDITFAYVKGRPFAPAGDAFERAVAWWRQLASDPGAPTTTRCASRRRRSSPCHVGDQPGAVGVRLRALPGPRDVPEEERAGVAEALEFMGFEPGARIAGHAHRRRLHRVLHELPAV